MRHKIVNPTEGAQLQNVKLSFLYRVLRVKANEQQFGTRG